MVDVIGRAKVIVESAFDKSSLDTSAGKIGHGLKAGALVGVAAVGTLTAAGIHAVHAFEDAEAATNKLNNVLGNMGKTGASEAVGKLADQLQRQTGVDDEVIKGGETILATFSEVAKSAGETGGAFERATKASVDLAAAGFGSVESASVMLGKALQDPLKGITALSRAGVTFTEVQKQQIENFVAQGDAASAQNLILKEVEKQVKGTARSGAKESDKLRAAFDEVTESLGHLIVKLITGDKKSGTLSDSLFDLSDSLNELAESQAWHDLGVVLRRTFGLIEAVADAAEKAHKWLVKLLHLSGGEAALKVLNQAGNAGPSGSRSRGNLTGAHLDPVRVNASGGRSLTAGLSWVGEEGPEIIRVPSGSDIYSNRESREMASAGAFHLTQIFNGPTDWSLARRDADAQMKYGTRFGSATSAGAL